ncbi:hypothetical protein GW17_00048079 [Ensete ventricosum]|nr:hypothetical protein GW17_00048079 [Ensete ventricosum]
MIREPRNKEEEGGIGAPTWRRAEKEERIAEFQQEEQKLLFLLPFGSEEVQTKISLLSFLFHASFAIVSSSSFVRKGASLTQHESKRRNMEPDWVVCLSILHVWTVPLVMSSTIFLHVVFST